MRNGKKFLGGLLALILCLSLLPPLPAAAAEVWFTAINERVLEVSDDTMPVWSGNILYAPYSAFDADSNGVMWDLECKYNKIDNVITVFDLKQSLFLEFDLREGTCRSTLSGEEYDQGAILRGGRPYLPVGLVCGFFGLTYSYRTIEQGKILRIRDDNAVLTDRQFLDAANNVINSRLKEYNQSQAPEDSTAPSVPQNPEPEEPDNEQRVETYLAFCCREDSPVESLLTVLGERGVYGMFLLTPELIRQRGELVFRILGEGHFVGLLLEGDDPEAVRAAGENGVRALAERAFYRPNVIRIAEELRAQAEQEGWICWNSTLDLAPEDTMGANYFAARTLRQLDGRTGPTYLTMEAQANTIRILPTLLRELNEAGFVLRTPLETRL